jgi:hypothetical protein
VRRKKRMPAFTKLFGIGTMALSTLHTIFLVGKNARSRR